ncbi:MAG TPA: Flp pilus assembly protein CpaB [Candidatus Omnitrophota bacterium]|nr:Flp pilus assembly protein CpaB [Candidatus Omnitrophota bacterium]
MNLENKKQIAIIILAVGLGLVASVGTGHYIQTRVDQETAKISEEFENKKVKPMMREIDSLRKEMQKLASMQAATATKVQEQKPAELPAVPKSSLALRTPAGKRAYTVRIDSLSAVGGLVNPGDYIDVIAHMDIPDPVSSSEQNVSSMVFQNIQILAVGTNLQAPGGYEQQQTARSLNITFALTPEEASLMSFIEKHGRMQLILRAPAETETEIIQAASWSALADYVFEKQGTELIIPKERAVIQPVSTGRVDEVKPFIQIFQGGRSL